MCGKSAVRSVASKRKKSHQAAKNAHFVRNHQLSSLFIAAAGNIAGNARALVHHNREFSKLLCCKGSKRDSSSSAVQLQIDGRWSRPAENELH